MANHNRGDSTARKMAEKERAPHRIKEEAEVPGAERLFREFEATEIDGAAVERAKNLIIRADLVDKLDNGGDLSEDECRRLGSIAKERGWFGVFNELEAGDRVAYFSTPGGEFSVKNLNTVFGEQMTDKIIDSRKKILAELMKGKGFELLNQDYRSGTYKLGQDADADYEKSLDEVADSLNKTMVEVIKDAVNRRVAEGADDKSFDSMRRLLGAPDIGFRANYGVSTVGEPESEKDVSNIVSALAECAQAAQMSRRKEKGSYGSEYSEERALKEISDGDEGEGINELGEKLADKIIADENGVEYKIFSFENGRRSMNRDLLRLARKGDFHPGSGSEQLFSQVQQYVRRINLLDLVKPFTAVEAKDGTIDKRRELTRNYLQKDAKGGYSLKNDLSEIERKRLAADLKRDQKDATYDSAEFFHKESLALKDCVYVNLDVLDLGVDLLLEYERLIQEVGEDPGKLRQVSVEAGDSITEKMRTVRAKALEVFQRFFPDTKPISRVGGDEISLALEDPGDAEIMEEFLLTLQNETGTRVIKTVVSEAERHSAVEWSGNINDETSDERLKQHLSAIKRAERGSEICKQIEKKMRAIEMMVQQKFKLSDSDESTVREKLAVLEIGQFKNIAVKEEANGQFRVLSRSARDKSIEEMPYDDVLLWIGQKMTVFSGRDNG